MKMGSRLGGAMRLLLQRDAIDGVERLRQRRRWTTSGAVLARIIMGNWFEIGLHG